MIGTSKAIVTWPRADAEAQQPVLADCSRVNLCVFGPCGNEQGEPLSTMIHLRAGHSDGMACPEMDHP